MKKSIADVISFVFIIFSMLYLKDKYHLNFWTYLVISVAVITIVQYFIKKILKDKDIK